MKALLCLFSLLIHQHCIYSKLKNHFTFIIMENNSSIKSEIRSMIFKINEQCKKKKFTNAYCYVAKFFNYASRIVDKYIENPCDNDNLKFLGAMMSNLVVIIEKFSSMRLHDIEFDYDTFELTISIINIAEKYIEYIEKAVNTCFEETKEEETKGVFEETKEENEEEEPKEENEEEHKEEIEEEAKEETEGDSEEPSDVEPMEIPIPVYDEKLNETNSIDSFNEIEESSEEIIEMKGSKNFRKGCGCNKGHRGPMTFEDRINEIFSWAD